MMLDETMERKAERSDGFGVIVQGVDALGAVIIPLFGRTLLPSQR